MANLSDKEIKLLSADICDGLMSRDPTRQKEAEDAVNEFTRRKLREQSFTDHILPSLPLTNDELDRQLLDPRPIKIVDMEPDSPASVSVPLGSTPMQFNINATRYAVYFDRILSPKYYADVDTLRTWHMDIRQVFSDNSIKDMGAELDSKLLGAVDGFLVSEGATLPTSGSVQYKDMGGPITRDSLWDSLMIMPDTPFSLEVQTLLLNHITIKHVAKLDRIEFGGDLAQDVMKRGTAVLDNLLDKRWVITIKKSLVPTGHMYQFGDPKFIGKHFTLEDTTMYMKREAFMLEFFAYRYCGLTLGHPGALARARFRV